MEEKKNLGAKIKALIERIKTDKKLCVILAAIALVVVIAVVAVVAVSCGGGNNPGHGEDGTEGNNGVTGTHTVSVKTQGGMALSEVDVYVYNDEKLTDLETFASTDESGIANLSLAEGGDYYIALSGLKKGYVVDDYYTFNGTTAVITVNTALITDGKITEATLGLGDVMYDFTVTDTNGEEVKLSELLKEKKMVMLNFWYTTCSWCLTEFPIMAEAYEDYKDQIEIVALNPMDGDAETLSFQNSNNLPFKVAACQAAWSNTFSISGYPTSVVIDRYGVICLVESGAITSKSVFTNVFDHFTAEDYEQKLCVNGVGDLVTQVKPNVTMPSSEEIAATINNGDIKVTYRPETDEDSAEYTWPFIIGEKNGEKCIYASNKGIESSYAILYMDVELEAGQALAFDYLASTESNSDIMHVIVENEPIFSISGWNETEKWETCYPCVAQEAGTYEVAIAYLKDSDTNAGDDTVYVKNVRVVSQSEIDTATYIVREAAKSVDDGFEYDYAEIVYNEADGYYHVGTKNGPLLLADLMGYTQFNEEKTVYELIDVDQSLIVNGEECYDRFIDYCSYASNSQISGICTVNKELAEFLKVIAENEGFEDNENEWLKICRYYDAYGTTEQLGDPIKGLSTHSAYTATLGTGIASNYFYYDRAIMPRGLLAEFVPTTSGVYRITSRNDSVEGVNAWIFDENHKELYVHEPDERMYYDENDISMVYYMEAGKSYYIDIAFWDIYGTGTIYYDIEYLGASYELFRLASLGFFTYDSNATGDAMYHVIAGGIDVVLNPNDGIYYEDLGKDANGNQKYGSKLYADFTGLTGVISQPITATGEYKGMIAMGAFNFSQTENDQYVLSYYEKNNMDKDATLKELKEVWGDDYDYYYEEYMVEDVLKGRYHGEGEDYTEAIKKYVGKMDTSGTERNGCVVVTEELAEILQKLMDKFTFEGVDDSWRKLCYYYDYLGPEK